MVQIASKMPVRGTLADSDGPLSFEDMSLITDFPESIFKATVEACMQPGINWIEILPDKNGEIEPNSEEYQSATSTLPPSAKKAAYRTGQDITGQDSIGKPPPKKKKFKIPTVEEIKAYCTEKEYRIDAEKFWHHYNARGWKYKTGQPMVSWKSALVTWKKNDFDSHGNSPPPDNPITPEIDGQLSKALDKWMKMHLNPENYTVEEYEKLYAFMKKYNRVPVGADIHIEDLNQNRKENTHA